jgi:hypothetical protein
MLCRSYEGVVPQTNGLLIAGASQAPLAAVTICKAPETLR